MNQNNLKNKIQTLKKKKDVTILSHYYQRLEIQEIADYLGDSLGLSRTAKEKANTKYIIFAGVDFMAETASILNPNKHILLPNSEACCPMAAFLTDEMVRDYKAKYPDLPVVTYVNSTAAVKAESDICCTSSNSVKMVKKIMQEFDTETVLFGPDANLASYIEEYLDVDLIKMPEDGHCITHSRLNPEDVQKIKKKYPNAELLVHPECTREVRNLADFIGSTAGMYNRVKKDPLDAGEFLIGTEKGLLDRMSYDFPDKMFHLAKDEMICYNMKKNTIELIEYILEHLIEKQFEVKVPPNIAEKALVPLKKMLRYS
ncbi:MAG: quinolinate synthase NadA [Promethearchaeia archaeon]